jgi:hypothetical protein
MRRGGEMIGRLEISEILGMAGTCAVLLFAGFGVETLDGSVEPSWAVTVEVRAPDVPEPVSLPAEIRLELPALERPVHPVPPKVSLDDLQVPSLQPYMCGCRRASS